MQARLHQKQNKFLKIFFSFQRRMLLGFNTAVSVAIQKVNKLQDSNKEILTVQKTKSFIRKHTFPNQQNEHK